MAQLLLDKNCYLSWNLFIFKLKFEIWVRKFEVEDEQLIIVHFLNHYPYIYKFNWIGILILGSLIIKCNASNLLVLIRLIFELYNSVHINLFIFNFEFKNYVIF